MAEVYAIGKYLRISPRKLQPVAALVKGEKAKIALTQLRFVNKKGARLVSNVLKSAIANAKNNFSQPEESLIIKKIEVGKGPMLKRWQPVSRGRAHQILKRMSHLKVVLEAAEQPKVEAVPKVETGELEEKSNIKYQKAK